MKQNFVIFHCFRNHYESFLEASYMRTKIDRWCVGGLIPNGMLRRRRGYQNVDRVQMADVNVQFNCQQVLKFCVICEFIDRLDNHKFLKIRTICCLCTLSNGTSSNISVIDMTSIWISVFLWQKNLRICTNPL